MATDFWEHPNSPIVRSLGSFFQMIRRTIQANDMDSIRHAICAIAITAMLIHETVSGCCDDEEDEDEKLLQNAV